MDPGSAAIAPARVESVETLRGIAALSVAWFHFVFGSQLVPDGWLRSSGSYGWVGVDAFFVISGFVVPLSMFKAGYRFPSDCGRFLLKRGLRLEPSYLVAVLFALVLWHISASMPGFRGTAPDVPLSSILLHIGYLNALFDIPWLNPVFWSLAIEFQFYLLFALVYPIFVQRPLNLRSLALASFCGMAYVSPSILFVFHYSGLFAFGIVTFQRVIGLCRSGEYFAWLLVIAILSLPILAFAEIVTGCVTALFIAFVQMPRWRVFAYLGAVSYSVYLVHVPIGGRVVNLGTRFADTTILQIAVIAGALTATLVMAHVFYLWVETPSRRWSSSIKYLRNSDSAREELERGTPR